MTIQAQMVPTIVCADGLAIPVHGKCLHTLMQNLPEASIGRVRDSVNGMRTNTVTWSSTVSSDWVGICLKRREEESECACDVAQLS